MKKIRIKKDFKDDYITRAAGERVRFFIEETAAQNDKIEIDFTGTVIASTSFFDEGFAKLALIGWDKKKLTRHVILKNLNPRDAQVMEKMCEFRGLK